jgi:hypothetical protein
VKHGAHHPGPNATPAYGEECAIRACIAAYSALAATPLHNPAALVRMRTAVNAARRSLLDWMYKREHQ